MPKRNGDPPLLSVVHIVACCKSHTVVWCLCPHPNQSQIAFWQKECPDDTCPASDGSYASVFPLTEAESQSTVLKTPKDEEIHLLGFIGLGLVLVLLACCSWLVFCLCCAVSDLENACKRTLSCTSSNLSVLLWPSMVEFLSHFYIA